MHSIHVELVFNFSGAVSFLTSITRSSFGDVFIKMVSLDAFVNGFAKRYAASFAPTPTLFRDFFSMLLTWLYMSRLPSLASYISSSVQKITHTPYIGDNVHCTSIRVQNKLDVNISWPSMEYSIVSIDFDVTSFLLQKYLGSFQRTSDAFDVIFFWWL